MSYVRRACNIGNVYYASVVRGFVLLSTSKVYILMEVHGKDYWNLQSRVSGKYVKL